MPMTNGFQSNQENVSTPYTQGTISQYQQPPQPRRDAEGYNITPTAVDDITRAQQEAAAAR